MLKLIEGYAWIIKLVLLGALFAGGWWLGDSLKQGEWDAARVKELAEFNRALEDANVKVLAAERASAEKASQVSAKYQKKLQEKDREKAAAIADAESRGLWVNVSSGSPGTEVPGTTACTCGSNGETRARLSEKTSRDLIALLNEADRAVEQLNACQDMLQKERNK